MSKMSDLDILVQNLAVEFNVEPSTVYEIVLATIDHVNPSEDEYEEREDQFRDDVEADADTLASIGWGTDEDYGYYGYEDEY